MPNLGHTVVQHRKWQRSQKCLIEALWACFQLCKILAVYFVMKPNHILHLPKISENSRQTSKSQEGKVYCSQGEIMWLHAITFLRPPSLQIKKSLVFQLHTLWQKQKIKTKMDPPKKKNQPQTKTTKQTFNTELQNSNKRHRENLSSQTPSCRKNPQVVG